MPYIGTPPNDRVLTSEDIKDGAIEIKDISWKNQPANENISGTIDSFTVKLAEQFTLTGDIDISKDLVLTKFADDGEALGLTSDASSRTIEGSGTISSNTFAQVPNAKLEGMTGVLDSTVQDNITRLGTVTSGTIGSDVINNAGVTSGTIGSSVTFPTGSVIQTVYATTSTAQSVTSGGGSSNTAFSIADNPTFLSKTITPTSASSKFLIQFNSRCRNQMGATGWNAAGYYYLTDGTSNIVNGWAGHDRQDGTTGSFHEFDNPSLLAMHEPNTTNNVTYSIKFYTDQYYSKTFTLSYGSTPSFLIIQEIAG